MSGYSQVAGSRVALLVVWSAFLFPFVTSVPPFSGPHDESPPPGFEAVLLLRMGISLSHVSLVYSVQ